MSAIRMSLTMVIGAVVLVILGSWGRRNAAQLVPPGLAQADRDRQERVLRRGALACCVAAGLFVFAAIGTLL